MNRERELDVATHEQVRLALPWLANETLGPEESRRVRSHVERCAACAAELDAELRLRDALRDEAGEAPAPHPIHLARLAQRLDEESRAEGDRGPRIAQQGIPRRLRLWRRIALGEAAAILALAALLVAPEAPSSRAAGEFRLLGAASGSIPNGEARRLRVVFDDRVDQRSLRELLLPLGAEIVGGPSPLGVYTVAVPEDRRSEPLTWLVSHLRSLPEVRFVEPVNEVATP